MEFSLQELVLSSILMVTPRTCGDLGFEHVPQMIAVVESPECLESAGAIIDRNEEFRRPGGDSALYSESTP